MPQTIRRSIQVVLFALLTVGLAACVVTPLPPTETPPPDIESADEFADRLTLAIIKRDYNQLESMMGDPFLFGFWQSEGFAAAPTEAVEEFRLNYLGSAGAVAFDTTTNLTTLLGMDPLAMWGPEVNTVAARYVTGLGADGATEAIFIIAQQDDGTPYWHSALIAASGFQPPVQPATATPTSTFTATPVPAITITPTFTPTPERQPERVRFGANETSATRSGLLAAGGGIKQYVLNAAAGQVMEVTVSGETVPINFTITSLDGTQWIGDVLAMGQMLSAKTIRLPQSGDYLVTLTTPAGSPATGYDVTFVAVTPAASGAPPERVSFAAGSTQATRSGALTAGGVKEYVLGAAAGQTMQVQAIAFNAPVNFVVTSPGGATYSGELLGSEVWIFEQTVLLPESGDYLVTLSTPSDAGPTLFDINFSIAGEIAAPAPERVDFAPGATSATLVGDITWPDRKRYIVRALAGQTMLVNISSPDSLANFAIQGVDDGQPYKRLENEARSFGFTLPRTQDYLVTVARPEGSSTYSLVIEIPPPAAPAPPERVNFTPGATSATRTGVIPAGVNIKQYILGAAAGQTMRVQVDSVSVPVDIIVALSGTDGALASSGAVSPSNSLTVDLPATTDYVVILNTAAAAPDVDYTVVFAIE